MEIVDFYASDNQKHWLNEIKRSDWGAGQFLYELLRDNRLKELCGESTKVLLLTDGDVLVSFCTYVEQDDVRDPSLTPWVGFVYTFPEYRGKRHMGKLLERTYALAKDDGHEHIYISTGETGLYEKYGYSFWKIMKDMHGEDSRVYRIDVVCEKEKKSGLYIVEGLPCSGKSSISSFIADVIGERDNVCFVDEGTGDHPADYEFHACVPAGVMPGVEGIISLSGYSGDSFEKLLQYKIYDFLPWETEKPLMLERWKHFAQEADRNKVYVFNCVLLQNPMCETMMRFGFNEEESCAYISEITDRIGTMNPIVIYLKNDDIAESVRKASIEREGWLESVIDYHVNGAYGKSINAQGFDGYINCLKERQERELRILDKLSIRKYVVDNPQRDWDKAIETLRKYLRLEL